MATNKGTGKLKKIVAQARVVQNTYPNMKWTECISRATKELKAKGKI